MFSHPGLLGAGAQSTAWLYMFWHGGFPIFVIMYALMRDEGREVLAAASAANGLSSGGTYIVTLAGAAAVLAVVCGLTLVATVNEHLPVLIDGTRFTTAMTVVASGVWLLSLLALAVLLRRRPYKVLDVWLMVVMSAWLFEMALSAILSANRYDFGWYVGRIYGLVSASFLLVVLLIESGRHYARLAQLSAELGASNESLEQLSLEDSLTGLANRRNFDSYLASQIAVARRSKRTLALVICDVDSFKSYNDHYGHQVGDECLKQIADALRSCCRRPADLPARYGGEEFALILPETDLSGATRIAEAAREAVARSRITHARSAVAPHVTISAGVAVTLATIDPTAQHLIAAADQALYEAKLRGRNRVVSAAAEPDWNARKSG